MFAFDIDNELIFLEKYNLTPTELMTIRTILLAQDNQEDYLFKFNNILTKTDVKFRDILISLQNKQIITKAYKIPNEGEPFEFEDVTFNKSIVRAFYRASFELGKELFNVYPQTTIVNGVIYALRRVSKKFNSLEDAFRVYGKTIRWNEELHNEIIELVKWGIDNDYSFTTLDDFIVDNAWESIRAIRDGHAININFNAIRQL